jgi:hypothetical protein
MWSTPPPTADPEFRRQVRALYRRVDMLELLRLLRLYGITPDEFFRPWSKEEVERMEQLRRARRAAERRARSR